MRVYIRYTHNVKNRDCKMSTLEGLVPLLVVDELLFFKQHDSVKIKNRSLFLALILPLPPLFSRVTAINISCMSFQNFYLLKQHELAS